ncbi:MAG: hypothetical protein H0U75_06680 [Legionella sp.]|nr:hypothetical protein [Legionella sp.]
MKELAEYLRSNYPEKSENAENDYILQKILRGFRDTGLRVETEEDAIEVFLDKFFQKYSDLYFEGCEKVFDIRKFWIEKLTRATNHHGVFRTSARRAELNNPVIHMMINVGILDLEWFYKEHIKSPTIKNCSSSLIRYFIDEICFLNDYHSISIPDIMLKNGWNLAQAMDFACPERFQVEEGSIEKWYNLNGILAIDLDFEKGKFLRCIQQPSFTLRLERKGFDIEQYNADEKFQQFLDPITGEIMQDPVVATDGRNYDRSTIDKIPEPKRGPFGREEPFGINGSNEPLRKKIEAFVQEIENPISIVTKDKAILPKPELLPGQIRFFDVARTGTELVELTASYFNNN